MPDGTTSLIKELWEIIRYPIVVIIGLLGWSINRQVKRIDEIDKSYIKEGTFNDTINSLRGDIKEGFRDVKQDFKEVHKRIDSKPHKD